MKKNIYFIFFLLIIVYIIGFGIDVMDIDASQYASMSAEMLRTGNFLHVYDLGKEYLDKPPFLFWISSLSMKFFGVNNIAYRLPSFLFGLLAIFSTFRFTKLFYNKNIAYLAAIILASSQGFFLMMHDIRTDTILMGCTIFSIWQLAEWYDKKNIKNFILACIGVAGGLMTKGPIALMVPIFAFGTHFLLHRKINLFFKWQYLMAIVIIGVLLLPMCIGLYQQFDLHPEKIVNGEKGVSGLRFYFWTQSFGRITGESTWNNNANIFFLLQNMLWSFIPWILFFLIGIFKTIISLNKNKFKLNANEEAISTGGFILSYLALGMSKYQLPHYIFVAFPFAAIITSNFIYSLLKDVKKLKLLKALSYIHQVIFILIFLALFLLTAFPFNTIPIIFPILTSILLIGLVLLCIYRKKIPYFILAICIYTGIGVNLILNATLYPTILSFQAGSTAGRWIRANNISEDKIFFYRYDIWRSVNFYSNINIKQIDSVNALIRGNYIITDSAGLKNIDNLSIKYNKVFAGEDYPVSKLTLNFMIPNKRNATLNHYVVIKIQ